RALSQLDSRGISRTTGGNRLLPLRAARCVDSPRPLGRGRRPRRHLSVVARRILADRDHPARGSDRMSVASGTLTGTLIAARDLRRDYHMGDELVHAVCGVSLDVAQGDYVAI